jgi:hypothetical protein
LKSQELVADPINKAPTRRYGVEFVDLDRVTQKSLEFFFTRIQQTTTQDYYES